MAEAGIDGTTLAAEVLVPKEAGKPLVAGN